MKRIRKETVAPSRTLWHNEWEERVVAVMRIGSLALRNPTAVAPMAGVTDGAFRKIMHGLGAGLIYTEMVSDKGILYRNSKTLKMLKIARDEGVVALQLFGSDPESLQAATRYVSSTTNASIIDLNLGCPVPKVVKNGEGAALMQRPERVGRIVRAMVEVSDLPITVKMRAGWSEDTKNAPKIARICETSGAKALAVHGRTRSQMYRGEVDLDIIRDVKRSVGIPVFGNGDITSPEDAAHMMQKTGVDGVMIGRALRGNPWLIGWIDDYLRTGEYEGDISLNERFSMIKQHAELLREEKGERVAVLEMRTHVAHYLKGLKESAQAKRKLTRAHSLEHFYKLLDDYHDYLTP